MKFHALAIAAASALLIASGFSSADAQARDRHAGPALRAAPPAHAPAHGLRRHHAVADRHSHRHSGYAYHREREARRYADTPMAQVRLAARYGYRSSHPRWAPSYRDHYHWALEVRSSRIEREIRARDRKLSELSLRVVHHRY